MNKQVFEASFEGGGIGITEDSSVLTTNIFCPSSLKIASMMVQHKKATLATTPKRTGVENFSRVASKLCSNYWLDLLFRTQMSLTW